MDLSLSHQQSIRVYSEDVDFMGIVYHANYLRYYERARTEMLRQNNLILSDLLQQDTLFAINDIAIKYIAPARLDDLLLITTQIQERSACSFMFKQTIHNQEDRLINEANIKAVCVNGLLKPKRLPDVFCGIINN